MATRTLLLILRMRVSETWLRTYAPQLPELDRLAEVLTDIGLEVEAVELHEAVPGGLRGVVVGEVLDVQPHPDADRLRICTVSVGAASPLQIVCGAANVAAGQKVPVATLGTTLHPASGEALVIKKSKLRGVSSEGMICAEDELGLCTGHDGILVLPAAAPVGEPLARFLQMEDEGVLEIGLTPNRTDALGHYGVARDAAAALRIPVSLPVLGPVVHSYPCPVQIEVLAPAQCPRYCGLVIRNVQVGPSPSWLQQRLEAVGQRSINNVVDATNYIMLELGQPLHAFDLDKIKGGKIVVRTAQEAEIRTLDDQMRSLQPADLLIADAQQALCIAGVMGGKDSGTTAATTSIFLESACFQAASVRGTSTRLQLFTDSAYRFARGADPAITLVALQRAAALILQLAGGAASELVDHYPHPLAPVVVSFSLDRLNRLAGTDLPEHEVRDILQRLDFVVEGQGAQLRLTVPSYRVDVTRFQDVAEEVLRIYGYNRIPIPTQLLMSPVAETDTARDYQLQQRVADQLVATGYYELRTNSLVAAGLAADGAVHTLNPLSEEVSVLRTSLLPAMLEVVAHNVNRQQQDLRLFEFGKTYHLAGAGQNYEGRELLALIQVGEDQLPHWQQPPRKASIFSLRRTLEQLQQWLGTQAQVTELGDDPELAYGLSFRQGRHQWARLGQVKPELVKQQGLQLPVFYACIDWPYLSRQHRAGRTTYQPLPKYPAVQRDLSMVVQPGMGFAEIARLIQQCDRQRIQRVDLFDLYQPKGSTERSYAVRIQLQDPNQTLQDAQVQQVMDAAIQALESTGKVQIRRA